MQCRGSVSRALALLALAVFLACPAAGRLAKHQQVVKDTELEATRKNYPVTRVIKLLTDMLDELKADQTGDEGEYEKHKCLCKSGRKTKAAEIKTAEGSIANLTYVIEESTALCEKLTKEIEGHDQDREDAENAVKDASIMREAEKAKFNEEKMQLTETIAAVSAARAVLSEHTHEGTQGAASAGSFLQSRPQALLKVSSLIREQVEKHAPLFQATLSPEQQRKVSLLSNAQFPTYNNYASQSGEIYGVLQQLQATFEADLAQAEEQEAAAAKAHASLIAVKNEQISASRTASEDKGTKLATAEETKSQAKTTRGETEDQLAADKASLADLEKDCKLTDEEWEERKQTRADEIAAVSQAISMLNNDAAFKTFTNTFNPSFLQETATVATKQREAASRILFAAAKKMHNPLLSMLAVQAKLDSFTRVKAAIDDMIADILGQKEADIAQRDWCIEENFSTMSDTQTKTNEYNALEAEQASLKADIDKLEENIEDLTQRNSELQEELKKEGDVRETQHLEFQKAIKVQVETQSVLKATKDVLEKFYLKKPPLVEQPSSGVFKTYEKKGGSDVLQMLDEIMTDASNLEAETRRAESDEQNAYEELTKDSNAALAANLALLSTTKQQLAGDTAKLHENEDNVASVTKALNLLSSELEDMHASCDFVFNNFEVRQTAAEEEVEALRQAKAYLSGQQVPE